MENELSALTVIFTEFCYWVTVVIMVFCLGYLPCYILAGILKRLGVLQIPQEVELAGLDYDLRREESTQRTIFALANSRATETRSSSCAPRPVNYPTH